MVESRSVIRNPKNARGLERDSRARLNFAFNTFPLLILSESLAQARGWTVIFSFHQTFFLRESPVIMSTWGWGKGIYDRSHVTKST